MLTEKGEGAPVAPEAPSRSRKTGPQTNSYVSQRRSHGTSNVTVCRVPASQLRRKRNASRLLLDSLRLAAALAIAVAVMVAAEQFTRQAHPVIVLVSGIVGLIVALMLIAHKELS